MGGSTKEARRPDSERAGAADSKVQPWGVVLSWGWRIIWAPLGSHVCSPVSAAKGLSDTLWERGLHFRGGTGDKNQG